MSSEKFTFKDKLKLLLGLPEVKARERFLKRWESFEKDCECYAKAWSEEKNLDHDKLCQISKACYNDELNCDNCPFNHTYGSCLDAIDMLIDYLEDSRDHWLACGDLGKVEEETDAGSSKS